MAKKTQSIKRLIKISSFFTVILPLLLVCLLLVYSIIQFSNMQIKKENQLVSKLLSIHISDLIKVKKDNYQFVINHSEEAKDYNLLKNAVMNDKAYRGIIVLDEDMNNLYSYNIDESFEQKDLGELYNQLYTKANIPLEFGCYTNEKHIDDECFYVWIYSNEKFYVLSCNLYYFNEAFFRIEKNQKAVFETVILDGNGSLIYNSNIDNSHRLEKEKRYFISKSLVDSTKWQVIVYHEKKAFRESYILLLSVLILILFAGGAYVYFSGVKVAKRLTNHYIKIKKFADMIFEDENIVVPDIGIKELDDLKKQLVDVEKIMKIRDCELETLAFQDSLTKLPNHEKLFCDMKEKINSNEPFIFSIIDIKAFRQINDLRGHDFGDLVLIEFSKLIKNYFGLYDDIVMNLYRTRTGGFAAVFSNGLKEMELAKKLTELSQILSSPIWVVKEKVMVDVEYGIASFPEMATSSDEIFRLAEIALYHVKNENNITFAFYEEKMQNDMKTKIEREEEVISAFKDGDYKVFYQPVLDVNTGLVKGFEALLRMVRKNGEILTPYYFIDILENSQLMMKVTLEVIKRGCRDMKSLEIEEDIRLGINISPICFFDVRFVESIKTLIWKNEIDPTNLVFEMTESVLIRDFDSAKQKILELKKLGISIALDDFGTGYSSLAYLSKLSFDFLKIDKAFIRDIDKNEQNKSLVRSMIHISRDFNLRIIAEGVESSEELEYIKGEGIDLVQGYLFSKPYPIDLFLGDK